MEGNRLGTGEPQQANPTNVDLGGGAGQPQVKPKRTLRMSHADFLAQYEDRFYGAVHGLPNFPAAQTPFDLPPEHQQDGGAKRTAAERFWTIVWNCASRQLQHTAGLPTSAAVGMKGGASPCRASTSSGGRSGSLGLSGGGVGSVSGHGVKLVVPGIGWWSQLSPHASHGALPPLSFSPNATYCDLYRLRPSKVPYRQPGSIRSYELNLRLIGLQTRKSVDEVKRMLMVAFDVIGEAGEGGAHVTVDLPGLGALSIERRYISFSFNIKPFVEEDSLTSLQFRTYSADGRKPKQGSESEKPHEVATTAEPTAQGVESQGKLTRDLLEKFNELSSTGPENRVMVVPSIPSIRPASRAGSAALSAHSHPPHDVDRPSTAVGNVHQPSMNSSLQRSTSSFIDRFAEAKARKFTVAAELEEMEQYLASKYAAVAAKKPPRPTTPASHSGSLSLGTAAAAAPVACIPLMGVSAPSPMAGGLPPRPESQRSVSAMGLQRLSEFTPENRRAISTMSSPWSLPPSNPSSTYHKPASFAVETAIEAAHERHRLKLEAQIQENQQIEVAAGQRQKLAEAMDQLELQRKKEAAKRIDSELTQQIQDQKRRGTAIPLQHLRDVKPFETETLADRWVLKPSNKKERAKEVKAALDFQTADKRDRQRREREQRLLSEIAELDGINQAVLSDIRESNAQRREREAMARRAWSTQLLEGRQTL